MRNTALEFQYTFPVTLCGNMGHEHQHRTLLQEEKGMAHDSSLGLDITMTLVAVQAISMEPSVWPQLQYGPQTA